MTNHVNLIPGKTADVTMPDGSIYRASVRSLTSEDWLASLVGHDFWPVVPGHNVLRSAYGWTAEQRGA